MNILDTPRLCLRTIEADDAPFYLALINDPSWIRNIGDKGIRTLQAARAAIVEGPCAMQQRLGFSLYLIVRRSDQAPLGLCGLIKRDALPDVDIGYAIAPPYWGQGYAYEAAQAVMAYAHDALGLQRLLGITAPENIGSNRLLRKLGLHFDKFIHLVPGDKGSNLYSHDFSIPA